MHKDFFELISVDALREKFVSFPRMGEEECPLAQVRNRVLAERLQADTDLPLQSRSCMDGFALRAEDSFGAGEFAPAYVDIAGEVEIESPPDFDILPGQCARIVTGGFLPDSADAVVMFEQTKEMGGGGIEIRRAVAPGENVMLRGEDAFRDEIVLEPGSRIGFREAGLLAAFGVDTPSVFKRPRVGIISTGNELIAVNKSPAPGLIRDVNSHSLAVLVQECGGIASGYGIVRDDSSQLNAAVQQALLENDAVLISGGSSVGCRDMTLSVLSDLAGSRIMAHGVALSPGKPTILCECSGKAIWGLPGQVTSVQVVMLVLVQSFLRYIGGEEECSKSSRRICHPAVTGRNIASAPGREDWVRVRIVPDNDQLVAWPITGKSGLLRTMTKADALLKIAAEREGLDRGELAWVWRL